jgi:hypothetical protein
MTFGILGSSESFNEKPFGNFLEFVNEIASLEMSKGKLNPMHFALAL